MVMNCGMVYIRKVQWDSENWQAHLNEFKLEIETEGILIGVLHKTQEAAWLTK